MVIEYIRYRIDAGRADEFERAYSAAASSLAASSHCLSYEVSRGVEDPESYVVRLEWDSVDGHEQGFRKSPEFQQFFSAVKPYFDDIAEMRHYDSLLRSHPPATSAPLK
jgi:quinol monooxygenase YgiN